MGVRLLVSINMISEFQNEYRRLSNFATVQIILENIDYQLVEQEHTSAKSDDAAWKEFCATPNARPNEVKKMST